MLFLCLGSITLGNHSSRWRLLLKESVISSLWGLLWIAGAPFPVCCSSQHHSTHSAHHPPMPAYQYRKTDLVSAAQAGSDFILWSSLQLSSQSYFELNSLAVSVGWHIKEVKAFRFISYLVHMHTACTALLCENKVGGSNWCEIEFHCSTQRMIENCCKCLQTVSKQTCTAFKVNKTLLIYFLNDRSWLYCARMNGTDE